MQNFTIVWYSIEKSCWNHTLLMSQYLKIFLWILFLFFNFVGNIIGWGSHIVNEYFEAQLMVFTIRKTNCSADNKNDGEKGSHEFLFGIFVLGKSKLPWYDLRWNWVNFYIFVEQNEK